MKICFNIAIESIKKKKKYKKYSKNMTLIKAA